MKIAVISDLLLDIENLSDEQVEKLLVVDQEFRLKGLITVKDIQKAIETF